MTIQSFGRPGLRLAALVCAALLVSLAATGHARAATCRVTTAGTTTGSGTWASPMNLQTALTTSACMEVWVAAGIYEPGSARTDSFNILPGVAVYGGFAGSETSRSARNPVANVTTLSGDIGSVGDPSDNSYHVVFMDGSTSAGIITASTVLDGFTISGGQADGSTVGYGYFGGGLYCGGSGPSGTNECSPTLSNLTFSGNTAERNGGAIFNNADGGISSPTLTNVTFVGNSAMHGGAMANLGRNGISSPTLRNVTFSGNNASYGGGAIFNRADNGVCSPILSNVTFSGNSASILGAAIWNKNFDGGTNRSILSNVILWGNTATNYDSEIENNTDGSGVANPSPTIDHSVVQDSGGSAAWDASLGSDGGANLDVDPVLGALGNHGGSTATILLGTRSSAIDTGTCSGAPVTDQRGVSRPQGPACDIGAVEMELAPPVPAGSAPVPMLDWHALLALAVLLSLIAGFGRWRRQTPRKRT